MNDLINIDVFIGVFFCSVRSKSHVKFVKKKREILKQFEVNKQDESEFKHFSLVSSLSVSVMCVVSKELLSFDVSDFKYAPAA